MGSQREEHLAAVRRERRSREFSNVDFIVQQGVQWRKAGLVGERRERERERERRKKRCPRFCLSSFLSNCSETDCTQRT